jgi:putative colanic acid biosynthesis acetyltransferase WcaF
MTILDASLTHPVEGGASFSSANRLYRAIWHVSWMVLCRWTPPPLHAWRRAILRLFGAKLGRGTRIYASTIVWSPRNLVMDDFACLGPGAICYNQAPIRIGARGIVSQRAHLCAGSHDVADPHFQLITKPILIGPGSWIAAEAFVGPGVHVGEGAVLAARGVSFQDLASWTIYRGNPAVPLRKRNLRSN